MTTVAFNFMELKAQRGQAKGLQTPWGWAGGGRRGGYHLVFERLVN